MQVRVNVVLPASSSSTLSDEPSPILKPQQINSDIRRPAKTNPRSSQKRSKKKEAEKKLEDDNAEAEKQKKLRYYIEKLLQMKHEEVENLSSASTNDSRKQVNFSSVATFLVFSLLLIVFTLPSAGEVPRVKLVAGW